MHRRIEAAGKRPVAADRSTEPEAGVRVDATQASPHPVGRHLLADLQGVAAERLQDESQLIQLLLTALRQAGFRVLSHTSHKFTAGGAGVTGVVLLSESHAAFHTYPEREYMALDVFSCGRARPDLVLQILVDALAPRQITRRTVPRG